MPPIPPKDVLGKWYNDDSEHVRSRKEGLEIFLKKMISHRLLCGSDDLKSFLTDPDYQFEKRKEEITKNLIEDKFNKGMLEAVGSDTTYALSKNNIINKLGKATKKIHGLLSYGVAKA